MAKPIGKTFVEIEIDAKKYNKGVIDVKTTTKKKLTEIEKAWKGLGKKSEATYDDMRAKVNANYDKIKKHSLSTADDIVRAEKAKNDKIARINTQQFGDQKNLIDKAKEHWVALSVAAIAAIVAIGAAIKGIIGKIQEWVDLAAKQELAEISLAAALEASGTYTDALNTSYQNYATSIQNATKYGDEEVLTLMSLMTNLGVTADKLEEATEMTIGLATATGRGTDSMATYVALALQGEFTMLRRYIPALRKTTDATEQMKIIQEFAARGFQVAEKQTESYAIGIIQLRNLYGDLKEKLGDFIIKNEIVIDLMKRTKTWLIEVADKVEAWRKANQELIDQKTEEVFLTLIEVLKSVVKYAQDTVEGLKGIASIIDKVFGITTQAKVQDLEEQISDITKTIKKGGTELEFMYGTADKARDFIELLKEEINNLTASVKKTIPPVGTDLPKALDKTKERTDALALSLKEGLEESRMVALETASVIESELTGMFDTAMVKEDMWTKAFTEGAEESRIVAEEMASVIEKETTGAFDTMTTEADSAIGKMIKAFKGFAGDAIDAVSSVASMAENIASKISSVISGIWSGLKSVMGMVGGVITFFITFPGDLQESLERFAKSINELPDIIDEFFIAADTFFDNLPEIITTFIDSVGVFIEGLVAALPRVMDTIIKELPRMVDALIAGAEQFILAFVEEVPRLVEAIMAELPAMITSFMEVFLPAILDMIPKVLKAILQGLPDIIKAFSASMPAVITALIDAIVDTIPVLIEELPEIIEALTTAMIEDSPRIIDALIKGVPRIVEALVKAIADMIIPGGGKATVTGVDIIPDIIPIIGPMFHKGGIIGQEGQTSRSVSTSTFANAPRAHAGLMVGEVPFIGKREEGVFTPGQMAALGGVTINTPLIHIGGNLIADKQTFDDFAEQIDYAITKRSRRVYA